MAKLRFKTGMDVWFAQDWDWKVVHGKIIRNHTGASRWLVKYDHCSNPEMIIASLPYCFSSQREAWNYLIRASRKLESKAWAEWTRHVKRTERLQVRKKDALAKERRKHGKE